MTDIATQDCPYNPPAPGSSVYPQYRFPGATVGSQGLAVRFRTPLPNTGAMLEHYKLRTFVGLDASLEPLLDSFADNVSYFSRTFGGESYGNINWIGDIGGPPGSARSSYHNVGKALDITWIQWVGGNASRPAVAESEVKDASGNPRPTTHRRLVAVEAGLRKWFGYVLNRYIGCLVVTEACPVSEGPQSPHRNHFHVDNACAVALRVERDLERKPTNRAIRSCHYFIQDCVSAFTDMKIEYDGIWGSMTDEGYVTLLSDLGMECLDPIRYLSHYMLFLDYIMMHGFADAPAGTYRWGERAIQ